MHPHSQAHAFSKHQTHRLWHCPVCLIEACCVPLSHVQSDTGCGGQRDTGPLRTCGSTRVNGNKASREPGLSKSRCGGTEESHLLTLWRPGPAPPPLQAANPGVSQNDLRAPGARSPGPGLLTVTAADCDAKPAHAVRFPAAPAACPQQAASCPMGSKGRRRPLWQAGG